MVPFIFSVVFLLICLTGVLVGLAWFYSPRFLWAAAGTSYVLSFLGAFSIGLYLLVSTFVLAAVALGWEFGWKRPWQVTLAVLAGIGVWLVAVLTIDDYYLFHPFAIISRLILD